MAGIGEAIGGAANLGSTLFGTGSTQNVSQNQITKTNFRPEDLQAITNAQNLLQPAAQQAITQGQQLGQQFSSPNFLNQFRTNVGPNVSLRTPGERALDATGQRLLSQEQNRISLGLNRQIQDIGRQFSNNPAIAQILQQQATNASKLQQNPLAFAASQEQAQRDILANQSALQQSQQNAALAGQSNQALLNQLAGAQGGQQLSQAGQQSAQNLLQVLLALGQGLGSQSTSTSGTTKGRSGGLFS